MVQMVLSGLLLLSALVSLPAVVHAATFYASPSGSGGCSTNINAPSALNTALGCATTPGDIVSLANGQYGGGWTINNKHGTAGSPIVIRAQNERQAWLNGTGNAATFRIDASSYLTIEGLRLSNSDVGPVNIGTGNPLLIMNSNHIVVRKVLASHPNRYCNCHVISALDSNTITYEDIELYYFHRHGITCEGLNDRSDNCIMRRVYCNSRDYGPPPDGFGYNEAGDRTRGQSCVALYPSDNSIVENCVSEGNYRLIEINALNHVIGNKVLGSISRDDYTLANPNWRSTSGTTLFPTDTIFRDIVAIDTRDFGIYNEGGINTQVYNATFLHPLRYGIRSWDSGCDAPGSGCSPPGAGTGNDSLIGNNILVIQAGEAAIDAAETDVVNIDYVNTFGGSSALTAGGGPGYTHVTQVDPQMGTCKVFLPTGSPMRGAGLGGADIGANIINRYVDGTLTGTPLWDPSTGQFPCGAVIAGFNDTIGNSCINMHTRFNVNMNGCTLPGGTAGLPAPTNLRVLSVTNP